MTHENEKRRMNHEMIYIDKGRTQTNEVNSAITCVLNILITFFYILQIWLLYILEKLTNSWNCWIVWIISCKHSRLISVVAEECSAQETNAVPQTSTDQKQEDQKT